MIDDEKLSDRPCHWMMVRGVRIDSRYGKQREFTLMEEMVEAVPPELVDEIKQVWCNSKQTFQFTVTLKRPNETLANFLRRAFEEFLLEHNGGHNGVWLEADDGSDLCVVDPQWRENVKENPPSAA
jgi:hypothetical protein